MGYSCTGLDIDRMMLKRAKETVDLFRPLIGQLELQLGDALDLSKYHGRFDIAFSDGVLEHFSINEAVKALSEQAKTAKHVVVAVPSKYLNEPFDGHYRFPHTRKSVRLACEAAGLRVIKMISYGNPPQNALVFLKKITPPIVWSALFRKCFSTKIVCVCESLQNVTPR